jgi:hypothetical protein
LSSGWLVRPTRGGPALEWRVDRLCAEASFLQHLEQRRPALIPVLELGQELVNLPLWPAIRQASSSAESIGSARL